VISAQPDTPVERLASVGPRQAARLAKLGIHTVRDLLLHLPRRYEDTRDVIPLASLVPGSEVQTIRARVGHVTSRRTPYKRMALVEASLDDGETTASAVWFNQPFLVRALREGDELLLSGKVKWERRGPVLQNPEFERVSDDQLHVGRLAPIYPETGGLTSRYLRERIEPLLNDSVARLAPTATVMDFVPLLAYRLTRERLTDEVMQAADVIVAGRRHPTARL